MRRNAVRLLVGPVSVAGSAALVLRTSRRYAVRSTSRARALVAASVTRPLAAGRGATLRVPIGKPVRRVLARVGRVPVKVVLRFIANDGRRLSLRRSYMLRASR
jgi:hypothetical protein